MSTSFSSSGTSATTFYLCCILSSVASMRIAVLCLMFNISPFKFFFTLRSLYVSPTPDFLPFFLEQQDRQYAMKSIHVNRLSKSRVEEFENEVRTTNCQHASRCP